MAVGAAGDDGGVESLEFGVSIAEGDDLRRADKGEVERIKEEDKPFAAVILQGNLLKIAVHHRLYVPKWVGEWIARVIC